MTEIEIIIDLYRNSERQGPGSEKDTLKALNFMNLPNDKTLTVADIGCGSGGQTLTLARNLNCQITAVDLFPAFLNELNEKSRKAGLTQKIIPLEKSMDDLPFEKESLDIIWSEGAIYNIGFNNGIRQWRNYLKKGGFLAVSEITWITNQRPEAIEVFWNQAYPEIDTTANKIKQLENSGYTLVGYFFLEQDSWLENYYKPMELIFESYLSRHQYSELAKKVVAEHKTEIDLYKQYKDYYSYGFYIARKN